MNFSMQQLQCNFSKFDSALGNLNISVVKLKGVAEALALHAKEGAESKGIKAHFGMDESGILNLVNVEFVSEKTSLASEEEGTFSKLGSTISKFFAGSSPTKYNI